MGLLDDAIREHLELKRRHGADPSEVARQESEALGPARRTRGAESVAEPAGDPALGDVPAAAAPTLDEDAPYLPQDMPEPDFGDGGLESEPWEPVLEEERPAARRMPDPEPEPEPEPEPQPEPELYEAPAEPEPPMEPEPEPEQPTQVYRVEDAEGDEDDVLEGTPEFLEETPEHDRLWFEQRPPKDFDFDK
jgi:hypothetical protein